MPAASAAAAHYAAQDIASTPPFVAGTPVIFRRDPARRVTVTGCKLTRNGWSVEWRAEPAVPGVTAATGCCPAERLLPAAAMWMVGGACPVFRMLTGREVMARLYRYYAVKTGQSYAVLCTTTGQQYGRFSTQRTALAYIEKMIEADEELAAAARWCDGMVVA
jgi:hypothetical protein